MEIIEFPTLLYNVNEGKKQLTLRVSDRRVEQSASKYPDVERISFCILPKDKLEATFHEYVRPTVKPFLTPFCTELTGITQV